MADKKSSTPKRYRNFATIVYPESAPADWQSILSSYHVPAFISPLHDKDKLPDGTAKKPHYHVMIMYEGVKTHDQVSDMIKSIGGVGIEVIGSISGYARYLCHLDDDDKYKYDTESVRCIAGADYYHITSLASDRYKALSDMCQFCKENHITTFASFADYCRENRFDWFRLLTDNCTYYMDKYIKSMSWSDKNIITKKSDVSMRLQSIIDEKNPI